MTSRIEPQHPGVVINEQPDVSRTHHSALGRTTPSILEEGLHGLSQNNEGEDQWPCGQQYKDNPEAGFPHPLQETDPWDRRAMRNQWALPPDGRNWKQISQTSPEGGWTKPNKIHPDKMDQLGGPLAASIAMTLAGTLSLTIISGDGMSETPKPIEPQEPHLEPGVPLRPDPGYPETIGGTRDLGTKRAETKSA
jgi:hypothetical protein